MMKIFVKTLAEKTIALEVKSLSTIEGVKIQIQGEVGIPADQQRLLYFKDEQKMISHKQEDGHEAKDDCMLRDYNIQKEHTLLLLRGQYGVTCTQCFYRNVVSYVIIKS